MSFKISQNILTTTITLILFLVLSLAIKDKVFATTYSPTTEAELDTALTNANDGDVIELSANIELTSTITIRDNITFNGNNYLLSGDDSFSGSVINVNTNKTVYFSDLAIGSGDSFNGGGIYTNGTIYLNNVILNGNDASNSGGGIYGSSTSNIILEETVLSDNSSGADGAGVHARGGLTVNNSTFISNTITDASEYGAGIYVTSLSDTTINISNSTFTDGSTYFGGGVATDVIGTVNFTNNTFYENINISGGGVYLLGASGETEINFTNNTFALNETSGMSNGNDIYYFGSNLSDVDLNLQNNIFGSAGTINFRVINNTGGTLDVSSNHNISVDDSLLSYGGTGNLHSTNPQFDAGGLADNGGITQTVALEDVDSPAVDAGTSTGAPAVDQRGELRDSNPDIGSYEFDHVTLAPVVSAPGNNYHDNELYLSYYLRETPTSGTVQIAFDSDTDSNDVTLTMEDSITDEIVDFIIPGDGDLTGISAIDSFTSDTLNSDIYTVTISYQDALGNPAGSTIRTNVNFDTIPPYVVIFYGTDLESTSAITSTYIKIAELPSTGDIDVELTGATTLSYKNFQCANDPGAYDLKCTITITGSGTFTIKATDDLGQVTEVTSPVYTVNITEENTSSSSSNITYGYIAGQGNEIVEEGVDLEEEELESVSVSDRFDKNLNSLPISYADSGDSENIEQEAEESSNNFPLVAILFFLGMFTLVAAIIILRKKVKTY